VSKLLDKAVFQEEDGTWTLQCPVTDGSCGTRPEPGEEPTPFRSPGWPSKKVARARLDEHVDDHKGIRPMSTLEEFREKHGLTSSADGQRAVVTVKDL
jgi:hypothetical protein